MNRQRLLRAALTALMTMGLLATSNAYARNDIPSCYGALGNDAPVKSAPARALYVMVDETVNADEELKTATIKKALRFIGPGDELHVVRFGAYIDDHYTVQPFSGRIDPQLDQDARFSISKRALAKFDTCYQRQALFVKKKLAAAIDKSFGAPDKDIPKTELLGNLASLSELVRHSKAERKVVLLFSDMLENSDITSFYHRGSVRKIAPTEELKRLEASNITANWGGATVYVMGAGMINATNSYRSESTMHALRAFWSAYFDQSHGELAGWGAPMLMVDLE